jgi:hypothetical protein
MRIKEIINEDITDIVARFYKEASKDMDRFYNPEDVKYKDKNSVYYDEFFKKWFKDNEVPVFTKPVDEPQPEYTNIPKKEKLQSPGYRGLQYALCAAGLPYDHNVQKYKPNLNRAIASQTMDGARNNNGQ